MVNNIYKLIVFFLVSAAICSIPAQVNAQVDLPVDTRMALSAKPYGDSIVIRVAPTEWALWRNVINNGFRVIRYETSEDENRYILPETAVDLTTDGKYFTPMSNEKLVIPALTNLLSNPSEDASDEDIDNDENIMASFNIDSPEDSLIFVGVHLLVSLLEEGVDADAGLSPEEFQQNQDISYMYAQMIANRNGVVADILGMRYVDYTAQRGKSYHYELAAVDFPDELVYDIGVINKPSGPDKIRDFFVIQDDRRVIIGISKILNNYQGYWVAKAMDENSFELIQPFPFVPTQTAEHAEADKEFLTIPADNEQGFREVQVKDFYFLVDSLENDQSVTYKIEGQTFFATTSEPLFVEASAKDLTPPPFPAITSGELLNENQALLTWDIGPEEELTDLKGFKVQVSDDLHGNYEDVEGLDLIAPTERQIMLDDNFGTDRFYYYSIVAVDQNDNEAPSPGFFLNIPDEEPPVMPFGLDYNIDTTGILTLTWANNEEKDLSGYRVFFSYERNPKGAAEVVDIASEKMEAYNMVTKDIREEPLFFDTIFLKSTLYDTLYYKVGAEDESGNLSEKAFIAVPIPDMVPPVPPILANPVINKDSIVVSWINSSSEDVVMQKLLRRIDGDTTWTTIAEITDLATEFYVDLEAEVEVLYQYTMIAIDDAEWESDYAYPFHARRFFDDELVSVANFKAQFDNNNNLINLSWDFNRPEIKLLEGVPHYFHLYKSVGDAPPILFQRLSGEDLNYSDDDIHPKQAVNYAIKVVFENGKRSNLTAAPAVITE